jgi:glutamate synthase (NADPH/NADH) large chain
MTGGRVVVLGPTGRNFAAGMSGGTAYVYDPLGQLAGRVNPEGLELSGLDEDDLPWLEGVLEKHAAATGSVLAQRLLANMAWHSSRFLKVMATEYLRAMESAQQLDLDGAPVQVHVTELAAGPAGAMASARG